MSGTVVVMLVLLLAVTVCVVLAILAVLIVILRHGRRVERLAEETHALVERVERDVEKDKTPPQETKG